MGVIYWPHCFILHVTRLMVVLTDSTLDALWKPVMTHMQYCIEPWKKPQPVEGKLSAQNCSSDVSFSIVSRSIQLNFSYQENHDLILFLLYCVNTLILNCPFNNSTGLMITTIMVYSRWLSYGQRVQGYNVDLWKNHVLVKRLGISL